MELLEKYKKVYSQIGDVLKESLEKYEGIKEEKFQADREEELYARLLSESNEKLREVVNTFFSLYNNLVDHFNTVSESWSKISNIPKSMNNINEINRIEDEKEVLRKIERLLERQNLESKLERMDDEEMIALYKSSMRRAERLREGLMEKVEISELDCMEAQDILRIDANVKIVSLIEEEGASLIRQNQLKQSMKELVASNLNRRLEGHKPVEMKKMIDRIHSSVSFLLRDMSDTSLRIKDWKNSNALIEDLSSKQVDYFLSQYRESFESLLEEDKKNDAVRDNMSNSGGENGGRK